ncbi:MAG: hypothetical protein OSB09_09495 [Planctomycetota bacterium]|nr:hypothetical protein [Planctomycetota bacterium]
MGNQDENQGASDPNRIGSPFDLGNFWQGLGPGGRLGLGLVVLFVIAFFFNSPGEKDWVDISAGDSTQNAQISETLRNHKIDFRFTETGVLQVQKPEFDQVKRVLNDDQIKEDTSAPFAGSLIESPRQRQQRWENSELEKLEQDLARFEGVDSVSVTPSRSTGRSVLASSQKINSVSVQADLDDEIWSDGLSQGMARSIALHVSGVYGVSLDKIIMTDTSGQSYNLTSVDETSGDIVQKKHDVERYVERYLSNLFSPEMFRIVVDVSLFDAEQQRATSGQPTSLVPGFYDLQKQVASYAPISAQFVESVVSRATSQQIPDQSEADIKLAGIHQVAVTVMLDRNEAMNRISAPSTVADSTGAKALTAVNRPGESALREFNASIVAGIKSHLKVRLGEETVVVARVVPASFGGILVATSASQAVAPIVTSMNQYPSTFYWMVLVGIISIYWVFRYGPVNSTKEPAIVGFGATRFAAPMLRETVNSIFEECENSITEKAINEISELGFEPSVEIIRFVSSEAGSTLPGGPILALLVLEQSSCRSQIFAEMTPEELTFLSAMILEVREIKQESIVDALAVLGLFQSSNIAQENNGRPQSFVDVVPTQIEVERTVLDDIRSSDENLANLIENHRRVPSTREVQS